MITIVDYGVGNLGSVVNMFRRIGVEASTSGDVSDISKAEKILLPGVGAFDPAMTRIHDLGLTEVLNYKASVDRIPILGICLGMQLLTHGSEEGRLPGFGWIDAEAHRFPVTGDVKIPHMGWNVVTPTQECVLTKGFSEEPRFYFVHSYFVKTRNSEETVLEATHGITFDAAIRCRNIFGVQFHPEKSHKFGMRVLGNFAAI